MENLRFTINKQKNKFYERRIKVSQFERQNFKDEKKCILFCAAHSLLSQKVPNKIIIITEKEHPFE